MGNLATPKSVQKLQTALHAKAKAEAGYRFYALYDKISRDDILAHAYAQCRSNKGAPGIDGQDFAGIEVYGVERWLAELALALRQGTYRPEPIRRVYIPKANGKLRPLGISSVRDRVCMTAATLVLEPIFEADLPLEQYAYRPGRNAQQAAVEVEELLFRGYREVVDADLADFFGSIPHTELMKSVARRVVDRRVLLAGSTGLVAVTGLAVHSALAQGTPTPGMPAVQAPVRQEWLLKRHEEIIEPELPIIDPHHHLWDRPNYRYLFPELLADVGSGHNIRATCYMNAQTNASTRSGEYPAAARSISEVKFAIWSSSCGKVPM